MVRGGTYHVSVDLSMGIVRLGVGAMGLIGLYVLLMVNGYVLRPC